MLHLSNPQRVYMTQSNSSGSSWSDHTVIDKEDLLEYLFKCTEWEDGALSVSGYCLEPNHNVIETAPFIEYVCQQYPDFVFAQDEIEKMKEDGQWPFRQAQKRSDYSDDPRNDGKLGELILFLFVDAVLDIPMVSHKIATTQEPVQEVKGSDGLFFGEYNGTESLAFGESKIHKRRSDALRKALRSINRFHDTSGKRKSEHELNVAADTLSSNLSKENIEKLSTLFTTREKSYQQIHPIFAAYKEDWLQEVQIDADSEKEVRNRVEEKIEESGVRSYLMDKLEEEEFNSLQKYQLIFFLLPLEDADSFREELQEEIFPFKNS